MSWAFIRFSIFLSLLFSLNCNRSTTQRTPILLASSLITLEPLLKSFTTENLIASYAASSFVAKQIANAHPCKAAIVADKMWAQKIDPHPQLVVKNSLVIASSREINDASLEELLSNNTLILADETTVPLGRFSQQVIHSLKIKQKLKTKKAATARQTFLMIQSSDDIGIVYSSDAQSSHRIHFIKPIPSHLHDEIGYYLVRCNNDDKATRDALISIFQEETFLQKAEKLGFARISRD